VIQLFGVYIMETVNTTTANPHTMSAFEAFKARSDSDSVEQTIESVKKAAKESIAKAKEPKQPKSNTKKQAAMQIFETNKDKGNGEIAKLIAAELEITYANAYYYVTRVFVR